jgi:hypothetical protein
LLESDWIIECNLGNLNQLVIILFI